MEHLFWLYFQTSLLLEPLSFLCFMNFHPTLFYFSKNQVIAMDSSTQRKAGVLTYPRIVPLPTIRCVASMPSDKWFVLGYGWWNATGNCYSIRECRWRGTSHLSNFVWRPPWRRGIIIYPQSIARMRIERAKVCGQISSLNLRLKVINLTLYQGEENFGNP